MASLFLLKDSPRFLMAKPQPQPHHIHALTGLRFVAALFVFLHHMMGRLGMNYLKGPFGDGGVSFFFVLSGFILTYVYSKRLTVYRDLPRFYFTRWARIWPLHVVTLVIHITCFFKLAHIFNHEEPFRKLILNALLMQSWVPNYGWSFSYNAVSWSISTEAFFYFMFPLLVIRRGRFWIKYLVLTIAIAGYIWLVDAYADAINQTGWASVAALIQCFPFARLFEFMTGMAVGYLFLAKPELTTSKRNFWKDSLIEFTTIGLLLTYYYWQFNYPRTVELSQTFSTAVAKIGPVLFYALLIFFFSYTRGVVSHLFSSRVMVYLGEISFAFYMIHFIIIHLLSEQSFAPLPQYYGGLIIASAGLSIAAASLLYHFIELPAKSSLLAAYDRGIWSGFAEAFRGIKKAIFNPPVWVSLIAIGILIWLLQSWALDHVDNKDVVQVINQTKLFNHPVHFDRDAVLFGLTSQEKGDSIELKLAWIKKRNGGRRRLLEIHSADDQMLYAVNGRNKNYLAAPIGEVFVETIFVKKDRFTDGSRLCLAFYGKVEKMAQISGGPRSFYNQRLVIFSSDEKL